MCFLAVPKTFFSSKYDLIFVFGILAYITLLKILKGPDFFIG